MTDVVLGNLGSSGTNTVGNFNDDTGPALNSYIGQGFVVSSPRTQLKSVSLWLQVTGTAASANTVVGILADNGGKPASVPLYASNSVSVGSKGLYEFTFPASILTAGSTYWAVPVGDVSWYLASGAPTQQQGSGYSFVGTAQNISSGGWTPGLTEFYSISVQAVPEPSTYALAAIGLGVAGVLRHRRRRVAI